MVVYPRAAKGRHVRASARPGRAQHAIAPGQVPAFRRGLRERLVDVFPGLLGPGRRAAWRRYTIRRALATVAVVGGLAVSLGTDAATLLER